MIDGNTLEQFTFLVETVLYDSGEIVEHQEEMASFLSKVGL